MTAAVSESRTLAHDGDQDSRPAGRYHVAITLRSVAGHTWYHVALTEGGAFGTGAREVDGWTADYESLDRARAEANRTVVAFAAGRTVEQVGADYERAQIALESYGHTYRNVSLSMAAAERLVDALQPLSMAQWQYDLTRRELVAA